MLLQMFVRSREEYFPIFSWLAHISVASIGSLVLPWQVIMFSLLIRGLIIDFPHYYSIKFSTTSIDAINGI